MACTTPTLAGGLLTNTNQHVAFDRMMRGREASIGIDGVYYNPAGVVFMSEDTISPSTGSWLSSHVLSTMTMLCLPTM